MDFSLKKPARRVLIYRLGSLGDTVVALPALRLVRQAFPEAECRMLTSYPPNAKAPASSLILESTGLVQGYMRYAYGTRSVRELLSLWWRIVRWRPDVLVYLNGKRTLADAKRDATFFRLCGITRMVGVPIDEEMEYQRRRAGTAEVNGWHLTLFEHECERLVRNLKELGTISLDDPASWDLKLTEAEHARAAEVLLPLGGRPFFAVSFGTKKPANDWESPNWCALLGRVAELYPEYGLVICGVDVEREMSEAAAVAWRARSSAPALNLCGDLSPRESAAVFQRARVFLGHDSGPQHLASAVQTPCVIVFAAPSMPGTWFPYGRKHHVLYHQVECAGCGLEVCTVEKKKCMMSITVEEVLAEVGKVLAAETARFGNG